MTERHESVIPLPEHRRNATLFIENVPIIIQNNFPETRIITPTDSLHPYIQGKVFQLTDSWNNTIDPKSVMPDDEIEELGITVHEFLDYHDRKKDIKKTYPDDTKIATMYFEFTRQEFRHARELVGNFARECGGVLDDSSLRFTKRIEINERKQGNPIEFMMRYYIFR